MNITDVRKLREEDRLGCTLQDEAVIDWLISEYDRLTADLARKDAALKQVADVGCPTSEEEAIKRYGTTWRAQIAQKALEPA